MKSLQHHEELIYGLFKTYRQKVLPLMENEVSRVVMTGYMHDIATPLANIHMELNY